MSRDHIRVRYRRLHRDDVVSRQGLAVTSIALTLLDLAAVSARSETERLVDRAERLRLFDLGSIQALLARDPKRRGARALRGAIGAWRPVDTRSELERRFLNLVDESELERPQTNQRVNGERFGYEVDCVWPGRGLIVQLDGFAYHRTRRDRERDASVDADLELAGYRVVRLTWGDVVENPARTARRLARLAFAPERL